MARRKPAAEAGTGAPSASLPRSLLTHVPSATAAAKALRDFEKALVSMTHELHKVDDAPAVEAARAFVVLHRLDGMVDDARKAFGAVFDKYKTEVIPDIFDKDGVPHVPLDEGFRVGVSGKLYAAIKADRKEVAYAWLRKNELGDLITETVNASTLSAVARDMRENQNKDLPEDLFNVADKYTTSVTKTAAKKAPTKATKRKPAKKKA